MDTDSDSDAGGDKCPAIVSPLPKKVKSKRLTEIEKVSNRCLNT